MDSRQAASILAACSWLKKQIGLIESRAKPFLDLRGGESKNAELPFGDTTAVIGKVIMAHGKKSVSVEDWEGLTEWVKERWPQHVRESVDPTWWDKQKAAIAKNGAYYDDAGEVCPYVVVLQSDSYSMTKLDNDVAEEVMQKLLRSGGLFVQLDGTPQLQIESPKPKEDNDNG